MHIILVSDRLATAKTIVLTGRRIALMVGAVLIVVFGLASLISYFTVRHAAEIRMPFLQEMIAATTAENSRASRERVRENLNAMAVRLGEMQAQMMRLDSMGERLAGLAGIKRQDIGPALTAPKDGRGGPMQQPTPLSQDDLQQAVDTLSRQLEVKTDTMSLLESQLLDERIRKSKLPTSLPLDSTWIASSFGWRLDPFTGAADFHPGVDFPAEIGTPIRTAAAGVIINVVKHPAYGNYVDIDHGDDLVTRYAHCSKILVQPGALVKRGQVVAEVGSTGRSTGPHLHFEVRIRNAAQNPNHFLEAAKARSHRRSARAR
ncbi:MAG: peptidoglycan DD-metalloendopeptidase family protein [Gammaproteobacteria bacterium]|nr:peptidoglycan DD-metalloendopeptidase family protein [Gammaproteobacteria bacterium]MBU1415679.1 peptidoglycan DD-metalloendopeptidase family protein [Gammaproteobacteria bacterium]